MYIKYASSLFALILQNLIIGLWLLYLWWGEESCNLLFVKLNSSTLDRDFFADFFANFADHFHVVRLANKARV